MSANCIIVTMESCHDHIQRDVENAGKATFNKLEIKASKVITMQYPGSIVTLVESWMCYLTSVWILSSYTSHKF